VNTTSKGWKMHDFPRRNFIIKPETERKLEDQRKIVEPVLSLGTCTSGLILAK
jgi:hypothetical protein